MSEFEYQEVDISIEKNILIGLIVSTEFIREAQLIYDHTFLRNKAARKLARWALVYYKQYGKAPLQDIQAIYDANLRKGNLSDTEEDYIENILSGLSSDWVANSEKFNVEYLLDETEDYFRSRSLESLSNDITAALAQGDSEAALAIVSKFRAVSRPKSRGVDPFSDTERIIAAFEKTSEPLLKLPGAMGKLLNQHLFRTGFIAFQGPEKIGKCLTGSQRVTLSDGSRCTIKEIVEGKIQKNLPVLDEDSWKFDSSKITEFFSNGIKPVYRITTKTGRVLELTMNHPLYTVHGWQSLRDLVVGDYIAVPKNLPVFGNIDLSKHENRLLAYLIAGGYFRGNSIGFTTADEEIKNDFAHCISLMGGCTTDVPDEPGVYQCHVVNGEEYRNSTKNLICSCDLMNKSSKEKHIPECIFTQSKQNIAEFLRVLYTCDGLIYTKDGVGTIDFTSASRQLSYDVFELLTRFGIVSKIRFSSNDCVGAWTVTIHDYENIIKFCDEIGFEYSKGVNAKKLFSILTRERKSKSFFDKIPNVSAQNLRLYDAVKHSNWAHSAYQINKGSDIMCRSYLSVEFTEQTPLMDKCFNNHILWDQLQSIEYIGDQETYDITVDRYHNFIAENIIVHNSYILQEFAIRAARQKCKVAIFEMGDMSEADRICRIHSYLAKLPFVREKKEVGGTIPVRIPFLQRVSSGNPEEDSKDEFIVKFVDEERRILDVGVALHQGREWMRRVIGKIKISEHFSDSTTIEDLDAVLEKWQNFENFIPDVVIIDYADIVKPSPTSMSERGQINDIWKSMRRLAQQRHCLVVTATQADAKSYNMASQTRKNYSEDKRKYSHVTGMFSLNQTAQEKMQNILRIGILMAREGKWNPMMEAAIVQCLDIGRPYMDSYITYANQFQETDEDD